MKLARWFAQAFVRRIAYAIAALVLAYVGLSEAHAGTPQQALQQCADYDSNTYSGTVQCIDVGAFYVTTNCATYAPRTNGTGLVCGKRTNTSNQPDGYVEFGYDMPVCTPPLEYDTSTHQCEDKRAKCQARNDENGFGNGEKAARTWTSKCISGCTLSMKPGYDTTTSSGATIYRGELEWPGDVCGTSIPPGPIVSPDTDKDRQECVPVEGQTLCIKPNGDHCYSASTGRQICWGAGETGTKTDGPAIQDRGPGTNSPPLSPPPPGETRDPAKPPVTTTTTTPNITIVTTTVTGTTTNGTDGGPVDSGEPSDGSDDDDNGTGDCGLDQKLCDEANSLDTSQGADVDGNSVWGTSEGSFTADESGFGFSRTCPVMPQLQSLGGQQFDSSDLCTLMMWVGFLILAAAHAHALYIMFGD